jgi:cytochrome bd-type quinol oxidase subunit 1
VLWLFAPEYFRLVEQNTHYAKVIVAAANGGEFAIGEGWLVSCKGRKVVVY